MLTNYALARDPSHVAVHRVVGRSYYAECVAPPLSIKCMFGGEGRYVDDGRRAYGVDDDGFLVLNRGNGYSVEKTTQSPMETFCIFFPDGLAGSVARVMTRSAEANLDDPGAPDAPEFNLIEHRHPHRGEVTARVMAIRAATIARRLTDAWLDEQLLELAGALAAQHEAARQAVSRLPWARASTRAELFRRIHVARDHMHAHLAEPFSLADAACAAALSPYHFLRSFRTILGVTPGAYVAQARLARARRLLERTDLSVTEVAAEVGYASLPSFITLFRTRTGCSPAQYRRARRRSSNPR